MQSWCTGATHNWGLTEAPDFDDRGCRTQIVSQVANARRTLDNWDQALHRMILYGDRIHKIKHPGALMGLKAVEQGWLSIFPVFSPDPLAAPPAGSL